MNFRANGMMGTRRQRSILGQECTHINTHKVRRAQAVVEQVTHTHTQTRTLIVCFYVCIEMKDAGQKLISLEKAIS